MACLLEARAHLDRTPIVHRSALAVKRAAAPQAELVAAGGSGPRLQNALAGGADERRTALRVRRAGAAASSHAGLVAAVEARRAARRRRRAAGPLLDRGRVVVNRGARLAVVVVREDRTVHAER